MVRTAQASVTGDQLRMKIIDRLHDEFVLLAKMLADERLGIVLIDRDMMLELGRHQLQGEITGVLASGIITADDCFFANAKEPVGSA